MVALWRRVKLAAFGLLVAALLPACSTVVLVADAVVSTGVAVVGTAADLTVAGVKAVAGGGGDETKKPEKR